MNKKPLVIEKLYNNCRFYYVIRFDIIYSEELNEWIYSQVELPYGKLSYDLIVNEMISYKYPIDKMQAIINNYLLEPDDENIRAEFTEMQNWRKYSKEYAKEIMSNF